MSDFDWLQAIASADECSLAEAALVMVRAGAKLSADDWRNLSTAGRAAVVAAQSLARVEALREAGRDIDAAEAFAAFDGGTAADLAGRSAARVMAREAARSVAAALAKKREAPRG